MKGQETVLQALGIEKPDEWVVTQHDTCSKKMDEDSNLLSDIVNQYLKESGNVPFALVINLNRQEGTLVGLTKLFYLIGFMRGKIEQEEIDGLGELFKEETK